jgi:hypothetical protein
MVWKGTGMVRREGIDENRAVPPEARLDEVEAGTGADDEPARAMRGVVFGVLFSVLFWLALVQAVLWLMSR